MNLEQALKILGLTSESSQRDTMQAYVALAQPYITDSSNPARAEIEEAFNVVTADWTASNFLEHYQSADLSLSRFNCRIADTKKLDEPCMLFLHIPVNVDYYTLGMDPKNFHLVTEQTSKARYWVITSDPNDTSSRGIPPQSSPAYAPALQPLQTGYQFDASYNRIPNARMIPGFIRYAFEGITPRQLINVFYCNERISVLVPHLSSVTTDRLSDVSPTHLRALQDLRDRQRREPSEDVRRKLNSDITEYIETHLTGEHYVAEAGEVTMRFSPEDILAIQSHMDSVRMRHLPARFFAAAPEGATASTSSLSFSNK
ncbi:hypothetical protein [Legionella shakespearei]|uniref:Uncharacterized protein n=1 Tax=Legionella shakespearei DSM 23087 TaxID=1122169 RepID=A0A0W0YMP4_9GAMM|nr:hypothetical protein [Legionella shakespearei]KTD57902.1 hypothetical protein Lsha_2180 [Legionella shakespearei DSM 23087]